MRSTFFRAPLLLACAALLPALSHAQWSNGRKANAVLGQDNFASITDDVSATHFTLPHDVVVDPQTGKVFVADRQAHRILRFSNLAALSKGAAAEVVLGKETFEYAGGGTNKARMKTPSGLAMDSAGRLFVADTGNNRVLRFDGASSLPTNSSCTAVYGQVTFLDGDPGLSIDRMNQPQDITVDPFGNLWVADTGNNRVLLFKDAVSKPNKGSLADLVLGQPNFGADGIATSQGGMDSPRGVAARLRLYAGSPFKIGVELWVADSDNNRILRFRDAASLSNGDLANAVLGQTLYTTKTASLAQDGFNQPRGLWMDGETLWVSDRNNYRVLAFESIGSKGSGALADLVIGQPDFTSKVSLTSQTSTISPEGLATDGAGNLFVAQSSSNRVTRFSPGSPQPDHTVGKAKKGQKGNNRYNSTGAGQAITIKTRTGKRKAYAFFTLQNDGPYEDSFLSRGTRGNGKAKVRYYLYTGGGRTNVTSSLTGGAGLTGYFDYRAARSITAELRFRKKFSRKLTLRSQSLETGAIDTVLATVKGDPG